MNILPKEETEFATADYWDKFFKERGTGHFEWYGEYTELCSELDKYVKPTDAILVVGCGNSTLSSDLYDMGRKNVMSIDISAIVIRQMKQKLAKDRPGMIFEQMDAMNMTFEKEKFTVAIDKGTLDALMPTDTNEDHARAEKLFLEVDKILKIGGRYIVISLLQSHILKRILSHFTEKGWMIRIVRCLEVEKKNIMENGKPGVPVFMVICTKLKKLENIISVLETNLYICDKIKRVKSKEEVLAMVEGLQKAVIHFKDTKNEFEIEFHRHGESTPRYLIYVVDRVPDLRQIKKYGAFIVPQGRDTEWMFGSKEGRKYLLKENGFDRLVIIILRRNQSYESMTEIQDELAETVLQFAPCIMEGSDIPYMTIPHDSQVRETIYRTRSDISGTVTVEEVEIDGDLYRRLIFMDNQALVQSEVKLIKDAKSKKPKFDLICPSFTYISYMTVAVGVVSQPNSVLVIGVGGGGLCSFLHEMHPNVKMTAIEIDPVIVKLAKEYFGLKEGKSLHIVVADGAEFVRNSRGFDVVMFDVDSKEVGTVMTSPPPQFIEPKVLEAVKNNIGNSGVFVINVACRIEKILDELEKKLRKYFSRVTWCNLREDINRIAFLSNKKMSDAEWRNSIKCAAERLNKKVKEKLKGEGSILDLDYLIDQMR